MDPKKYEKIFNEARELMSRSHVIMEAVNEAMRSRVLDNLRQNTTYEVFPRRGLNFRLHDYKAYTSVSSVSFRGHGVSVYLIYYCCDETLTKKQQKRVR